MTYIPTGEGWLYLAVILDLFSRRVVGWATRDPMRAELTIAALTMAIQRRRPEAGLIHHSDRGSQYAAGDYRGILQAAAITQSMSRKGNCWDNAPMESFFGTPKTELVHHREYPDREAARRDPFAYIEGNYNRQRSTLPSATSPKSRQRRNPRNPVSTLPGEGQIDPDAAEIFRKEALDRLAQQERLDVPVALSATRRWTALAALALLAAAALLCLFIG